MYRLDLTEDQARRLAQSKDVAAGFSILLEAAGPDLILRYLAQSKPRPPLQVTWPAGFTTYTAEKYAPMIDAKIDLRRIELGIDGDHAFALHGDDIQSGESEFVPIQGNDSGAEIWAAKQALNKLRDRLGKPDQPYYFGKSHPYGS